MDKNKMQGIDDKNKKQVGLKMIEWIKELRSLNKLLLIHEWR